MSDWFRDLFINEAKTALNRGECAVIPGGRETDLVDRVTGAQYKLYVSNGELSMEEVLV